MKLSIKSEQDWKQTEKADTYRLDNTKYLNRQ